MERKVKLEKNNASQKDVYRSQFSSSMGDLHQSVLNYCEVEKKKSNDNLKWLENEIEKKNELVSRQHAFFQDMMVRRQQLINKIIDTDKVGIRKDFFHDQVMGGDFDNVNHGHTNGLLKSGQSFIFPLKID